MGSMMCGAGLWLLRGGRGGAGSARDRGAKEAASHFCDEFSHLFGVLAALVFGFGPRLAATVLVCGVGSVPVSVVVLAASVAAAFVPAVVVAATVSVVAVVVAEPCSVPLVTCFALILFVLVGACVLAAVVAAGAVPEGALAALRCFLTLFTVPATNIIMCGWELVASLC